MSRTNRTRNRRSARRGRATAEGPTHFLDAVEAELALAHPRALSLCDQVRRALDVAVGGECRDERVNELVVLEVLPDPTIRRLRVWLGAPAGATEADRDEFMERLFVARGFLRSRVAAAIHRKRTPELGFEVVIPFDAAAPRKEDDIAT